MAGSFEEFWQQGSPTTFPDLREKGACEYARRFGPWADSLCARAEKLRSAPAISQAKLALLDRYFDWRQAVPLSHRTRMADKGHRCIWHVFADAYERLKLLELELPPNLTGEQTEAEPDIWLGEVADEQD